MALQNNARPVIGIVPCFDPGIKHFTDGIPRIYLRKDYLEALSGVGALPVILNANMLTQEVADLCDGIVISGGEDIDPAYYGEDRLPEVVDMEPAERFTWEFDLLNACDKARIPVLGICYGMQRLNVHYGGSLLQDIPKEYGDNIGHNHTEHAVDFVDDFLGVASGSSRTVASRHHQAVARLAENFTVAAIAPDGIIEAFHGYGRYYGMQWHPESDATGAHVYRAFVELCMRARST